MFLIYLRIEMFLFGFKSKSQGAILTRTGQHNSPIAHPHSDMGRPPKVGGAEVPYSRVPQFPVHILMLLRASSWLGHVRTIDQIPAAWPAEFAPGQECTIL